MRGPVGLSCTRDREATRERRWTTLVRQIQAEPVGDDRVGEVLDRDEVEWPFAG